MRGARPPTRDGAGLAEAGDHGLAGVEHLLDLVGGDGQVVGVVGLEVGRADDAHGVVGHEDVTIGRPHAAVDDRVGQAVVHRDHDACTGDDVDAVAVRHARDLSGPGAATVQDEGTFDADVLAAALIVDDDGGHAVTLSLDVGHAMVGQDLCAVCLRGADRTPGHLPAVDGSVLDGERALDARVQSGFASQSLGDGDFLCRHLCGGSTGQELVRVFFIVVSGHHEEASGGLDGVGVDALDDVVFFRAFGGRLGVGGDVACTGVE